MSCATMKNSTVQLLEELYKNVKMGSDSILSLLPKIEREDSAFKSDLTLQLDGYERYANRINTLFRQGGENVRDDSLWNKMSARVGSAMGTLMDSSVSHIADMVIQGSTMNMDETIRLLRQFENSNAGEDALTLARDLIRFEEQNVERLKAYL